MTEAELVAHYAKLKRKFYAKRALPQRVRDETKPPELKPRPQEPKPSPVYSHPVSMLLEGLPASTVIAPLTLKRHLIGFGWVQERSISGQLETIIRLVLNELSVPRAAVFSQSRSADLVRARHLIWALSRNFCELSYPRIGRKFSRDHTTIMHGAEKGTRDPLFALMCEFLNR